MNMITIATNFNLTEAELVRARLEAAGFHPVINNENFAGWLGGTSSAAVLRVEVPEEEAADAKELLDAPAE
jgi:Putative prokaryotic signal transducing protein